MPFANIETGINLYYKIYGQGYPLILLGGLGADNTVWDVIRPYLQNKYQVIVLDNRGTGKSDGLTLPCTIDIMAADVIGLMNKLNISEAHVVGHSMGGAIALTMSLIYPQRVNKLILAASFGKLNKAVYYTLMGRLKLAALDVPLACKIETNLSWLYSSHFLENNDNVTALIKRNQQNQYPQSLISLEKQINACVMYNLVEKMSQIKHTPFILYGQYDLLITLDHIQQLLSIPGSTFDSIAAGHMLIIEQPKKTSLSILNFLN